MTEATPPTFSNSSGSQTTSLREEVSGDAARLADTAKQRIDQAAEGQKQAVTGAARSATSAIGRAVSALREDDAAPEWLTKAFETTARQIESLAGSIEGKNVDDIRRNVTQFARQNPLAFLAASAAAGFAAARFLRAGSEYKSHQSGGAAEAGIRGQSAGTTQRSSPAYASADTPIYGTATTPEFTS